MSTQDVKDYFYRHFLGLVKVNSLPVSMEPPQLFSQRRDIDVHPAQMRTSQARDVVVHAALTHRNMNVAVADLLTGGISCSSQGFRFATQLVKVKEAKISRYAPEAIAPRGFTKLRTKVREGVKRLSVLPQERANRLQWQTFRPRREGEMILAWFGPIVEDAAAKLTLNKRRGTLLIWYNPQSRHFDAKGLYLYRRLGVNENLEWRWM